MRALTVIQPWASLIAIGAKRIETRSWETSHRGLVAIHAAKGCDRDSRDLFEQTTSSPFTRALQVGGLAARVATAPRSHWYHGDRQRWTFDLPRAAIIATAVLVDCCHTGDCDNYQDRFVFRRPGGREWPLTPQEKCFGNYQPRRFAWLLDDVRALAQPIPCRGALGLWTVPADIERQIREAA